MERVQVFKADTTQAVKSLRELQKELSEIKNRMAELDSGSSEFQKLSDRAGEITSNINDINLAVKDSADSFSKLGKEIEIPKLNMELIAGQFGKITAGVAGGFNLVNGALKIFNVDNEEANQALTEMQAILQGLPVQLFAVFQAIQTVSQTLRTIPDMIPFFSKSLNSLNDFYENITSKVNNGGVLSNEDTEVWHKVKNLMNIFGIYEEIKPLQEEYKENLKEISTEYIRLGNILLSGNIDSASDIFANITDKMNDLEKQMKEIAKLYTDKISKVIKKTSIEIYDTLTPIQKLRLQIQLLISSFSLEKFTVFSGFLTGLPVLIAGVTNSIIRCKNYWSEMNDEAKKSSEYWSSLFGIEGEGLKNAADTVVKIKTLYRNAQDENNTLENRKEAIRQLNILVPEYNGNIDDTTKKLNGNSSAISKNINELERQAIAEAAVSKITDKYKELIDTQLELNNAGRIKKMREEVQKEYDKAYKTTGISVALRERYDSLFSDENDKIVENIDNLKFKLADIPQEIEDIYYVYDTNLNNIVKSSEGASTKIEEEVKRINETFDRAYQQKYHPKTLVDTYVGNIKDGFETTEVEFKNYLTTFDKQFEATKNRLIAGIMDPKTAQEAKKGYIKELVNLTHLDGKSLEEASKEWEKKLLSVNLSDEEIKKSLQELSDKVASSAKGIDIKPVDISVRINVGEFPENERIRSYLTLLQEMQNQMNILNDTMQRFGESSMGLGGDYANVVSDFSQVFETLSASIKKNGEVSWDAWTQAAAGALQGVGSLLNALGNEEDTNTKKGFEAQKKFQISATVMNAAAGIMNAWLSAMSPVNSYLTMPGQIAIGASSSAMIAALAGVQIAKIANQKFGEGGSVNGSAVNSTLIAPTQYTQAVQGANIETQLGDNRVWVSETDISSVGNRVRVQESENTY